MKRRSTIVFAVMLLSFYPTTNAQTTYTITTSEDAFLATGSPDNPKGTNLTAANFGSAGILAIAPASSVKGEFQSVLKFNLSGITNLFNSTYSSGWTISEVSLELASNFGTTNVQPDNSIFNSVSGGNLVIEWMADDNWVEGTGRPNSPTTDGVTYSSISNLLMSTQEIHCTNTYLPPGNNVHVTWPLPLTENLVNDIASGGAVSFRLYAADDQIGYLFNSHNFGNGNEPLIHVTATPLLKIISGYFTNGFFHLIGIGVTNMLYQVQANADIITTNWQTLGTVFADGSGTIEFDDTTVSNKPQRFYRLSR